jgi:HK97 family phage prohead protease
MSTTERASRVCVRAFDFELRSAGGDGRTLEGYAAVFGSPARIHDLKGPFEETIRAGAFTRSLSERTPVLQFEHGRDPRVGAVPIGAIDDLGEDKRGLFVRAKLFDNPVVEPVRQAIAGKAIKGMSFRFDVPEGGDAWGRNDSGDTREIRDANVHELGPVVFPAYDATTVGVRSLLATVGAEERQALIRELAEQLAEYVDIKDLAGRSDAWSADGGDNDTKPGNGDVSPVSLSMRFADDGDSLRLRGIML